MRALLILLVCAAAVAAQEEEGTDPSLKKEVDKYLDESKPTPIHPDTLETRWIHGPHLISADRRTLIHIRGRLLVDTNYGLSDTFTGGGLEDSVFIRQARLGVAGTVYRDTIFALEVDFASGTAELQDAFVGLARLGGRYASLRLGHQREPFGLEAQTALLFLSFMERSTSTSSFAPNRNVGARFTKAADDLRTTWSVGVYRQTNAQGASSGSGGQAVSLRVTGLPIREDEVHEILHVGLSASFRKPVGGMAQLKGQPEAAGPDPFVDTGPFPAARDLRVGAEVAFLWNSFRFQLEAFVAHLTGSGTDATFWGGYFEVAYWLTGEQPNFLESRAVYGRTAPHRNFFDGGGFAGSWELALRFDLTDLTDGAIEGGEQVSATVGVVWGWNANTRILLNVVWGDVDGGPTGGGTFWILETRVQFDF